MAVGDLAFYYTLYLWGIQSRIFAPNYARVAAHPAMIQLRDNAVTFNSNNDLNHYLVGTLMLHWRPLYILNT